MLYSFRLHYIQFKEVNILWGPGAGGWITQRPRFNSSKFIIISVNKLLVLELMTEIFTKFELEGKKDEINNLEGTYSQK